MTRPITTATEVVRTGTQEYTQLTQQVEPVSPLTGAQAYSQWEPPSQPLPTSPPEPPKAQPQRVAPQKVRKPKRWPTVILTGGVLVGALALGVLVPEALIGSTETGVQAAPKPAKVIPTTVTVQAPAPAPVTVQAPAPAPVTVKVAAPAPPPPPVPAPAPAGDGFFLGEVEQDFGDRVDAKMINLGHLICKDLGNGYSFGSILLDMTNKGTGFTVDNSAVVARAAVTAYCPQHQSKVPY